MELAFSKIGVEEPTTGDLARAVLVLNVLSRSLDPLGELLHAVDVVESTLTLVGDQETYTTGVGATNIAADIIDIPYMAILTGTDRDPPLQKFTKEEALRIPLQSDTNAQPDAFYLDRKKLLADNVLHFFPTPNQAYSVVYNKRRPLFDFNAATSNPDMPSEFNMSLIKLLAAELGDEYGTPPQVQSNLENRGRRDFFLVKAIMKNHISEKPVKGVYF